jgi:hypothetical protein
VVSHGYIVASIEPTYEVPVAFPDERVVPFSEAATGRNQPTPPDETQERFLQRMHAFDAPHFDKWAADIRFTIDQVTSVNIAGKNTVSVANLLILRHAKWSLHDLLHDAELKNRPRTARKSA